MPTASVLFKRPFKTISLKISVNVNEVGFYIISEVGCNLAVAALLHPSVSQDTIKSIRRNIIVPKITPV